MHIIYFNVPDAFIIILLRADILKTYSYIFIIFRLVVKIVFCRTVHNNIILGVRRIRFSRASTLQRYTRQTAPSSPLPRETAGVFSSLAGARARARSLSPSPPCSGR